MPVSSADISGLVGGQMAMFSNQSAYSQQIGGMVGTAPQGFAGVTGMQNPYQNFGTSLAGGAAMSMGGAATGLSIAGGLMGGAAGMMDPFTMAGRGFAAGTGSSGFMAGLSSVGSAFSQGGLRAGMGMMAGGLGGAAMSAALPLAAGAAVSYAGNQMYQGVQNMADVGAMSGHFGTQFGQPGSTGGRMGRQTIKQVTSVLHELVGDDMRTTMEEIKKVMDSAGQMGMLTGITDANTFKQKFGGIIKQVRQIADVMGTTISEAAPLMGQLGSMGLWTSADVMGTAVAGRMAGGAAPQMMQTMGQGAQVSHAMGGTLRAGAMMGRESFMDIQAAQQTGVISNRDIMEYTGGVGGAQGQRLLASGMQGIMSKFGQTSAGRLMMAGLGARSEEGAFTGEIDQSKLQDFLGGGTSIQDLQRQGRKQLSGVNAASFMDVEGELSQNLGAQGGIGAMSQITEQVLGKMGGSGKLRQQLMRQMLGISNREAKMLGKLMDDMPRIRDQQEKAAEDAINQAFETLERKQYQSWEGLKGAVSSSWEEGVSRPFQEAGEKITADFGEAWENLTDKITGKTRRISMGSQERSRLIRGGALTQDFSSLGLEDMGQEFVTGGTFENLIRGIRSEPLIGVQEGSRGTNKQRALRGLGIGTQGGSGALDLGGGFRADIADVRKGLRYGSLRAQGAGRKAFGFDKDSQKVADFRSGLKKLMGQRSEELSRIKDEKSPEEYARKVLKLMDKDYTEDNLNLVSLAQQEEEYMGSGLEIDFRKMSAEAGGIPTTPRKLAEFQKVQLDKLTTMGELGGTLVESGAIDELVEGNLGEALKLGFQSFKGTGIKRSDMEEALTGESSGILKQYMSGEMSKGDAITDLMKMKGKGITARKLIESGVADRKEFKEIAGKFSGSRGMQAKLTALPRIQEAAARGPGSIKLGRGGGALQEKFSDIVNLYRGGEDQILRDDELTQAQDMALAVGQDLTKAQANKFRRKGGIAGRQIAGISDVTRFAARAGMGDIGEKGTEALQKKLEKIGYDLEKDPELKKMLEGGISKEEAKDFGRLAADVIKTTLSETAEARKTHNQMMLEQMNIYVKANTKFVTAVAKFAGHDVEVEETSNTMKESGSNPTAPPGVQPK